ncbi:DNA primase [Candidatus Pacearchaeota archaeon]|nr:DNA primase [Candidatus Pacearchaeota archaeon]
MAKVSPVSIKYMIYANFIAEGALEKPDVIGAIFGQTEGLLGSDLEMRDLQKEGKIGRIEVDLERSEKKTKGQIKIPTALDQSETSLIAAAIETIERIGPSDAQIEVERIEDVRGSKRDFIVERAKKLMKELQSGADSREFSTQVKDYSRISGITEYGDEKLPAGDISEREVIVVEGRADVVNLLKNGIKNVIGMNGTNLPNTIRDLSREKEITLFVDGDRGGKLIARNVTDNANVKYIATAPDGKEVEELNGKEIFMCLRKKVPVEEFFYRANRRFDYSEKPVQTPSRTAEVKEEDLSDKERDELRAVYESNKKRGKAIILDRNFKKVKSVSAKSIVGSLRNLDEKPYAIVIDGTATAIAINAAEDADCKVVVADNFSNTSSKLKLLSL